MEIKFEDSPLSSSLKEILLPKSRILLLALPVWHIINNLIRIVGLESKILKSEFSTIKMWLTRTNSKARSSEKQAALTLWTIYSSLNRLTY